MRLTISKKLLESSKSAFRFFSLFTESRSGLGCFATRFGLVLPNCVAVKRARLKCALKTGSFFCLKCSEGQKETFANCMWLTELNKFLLSSFVLLHPAFFILSLFFFSLSHICIQKCRTCCISATLQLCALAQFISLMIISMTFDSLSAAVRYAMAFTF